MEKINESSTKPEARVLVTYMSQSGNTKKVAKAIFEAIPELKEIKRKQDVASLDSYDLTFIGFPIHGSGPDDKARAKPIYEPA